jgi:hypothetical protein
VKTRRHGALALPAHEPPLRQPVRHGDAREPGLAFGPDQQDRGNSPVLPGRRPPGNSHVSALIRVWAGLLTAYALVMASGIVQITSAGPHERFMYASSTVWKMLSLGAVAFVLCTGGRSVAAFWAVQVGSNKLHGPLHMVSARR